MNIGLDFSQHPPGVGLGEKYDIVNAVEC
jgi:hypothetical protein